MSYIFNTSLVLNITPCLFGSHWLCSSGAFSKDMFGLCPKLPCQKSWLAKNFVEVLLANKLDRKWTRVGKWTFACQTVGIHPNKKPMLLWWPTNWEGTLWSQSEHNLGTSVVHDNVHISYWIVIQSYHNIKVICTI